MADTIRLVFYCERRFSVSRFITWVTNSSVSGVAFMYWDDDWKNHIVMEAVVGGFKLVPFDKFEKYYRVVAIVEPRHSIEKGLAEAVDYLGRDLEYVGLFGITGVEIRRWFKNKWKNPILRANALFNSEIAAFVCKWSNYPGSLIFDPESIKPEDLFEFFMREQKPL